MRKSLLTSVTIGLFAFAAPAAANINGFEAGDADQIANNGGSDWSTLAVPVARVDDAIGSADDVFSTGSKENEPAGWSVTSGGANSKSDVRALWSAFSETPSADAYLYLAFKREGGTGDGFYSFELNQTRATWTNANGMEVPCRTDGDVLVSYEIPSTGSAVQFKLFKWVGSGGPATCPDGGTGTWSTGSGALANPEGALNWASPVSNSLSGFAPGTTFATGTFGEAGLDLRAIAAELDFVKGCEFFEGLSAHTRNAAQTNSSLADIVGSIKITVPACKPVGPNPGPPPATPTLTAAGSCSASSSVVVSGIAEPGTQVLVREGNTTHALADTAADGKWSATVIDLTDGAHSIVARAVGTDGQLSADSAPVSVFVDTTPDAATTITSPSDGSNVAPGAHVITGTAEPGSAVTVTEGAQVIGVTTADGTGAWTLPVAIGEGTHTYRATASDGCNASSAAVTVTVTAASVVSSVDETAPAELGVLSADAAPTQGVAPLQLGGVPKDCTVRTFGTYVADPKRRYKRVVFKVDGKAVKTARKRNRQLHFVATINPRKFSAGEHKLTATVVPVKGKAFVVKQNFRRCATCVSRRAFRIRVRKLKGGEGIRSATVYVNGKRVKVVRGKRLRAPVVLTGLPKGRFKVKITAVTLAGRKVSDTRTYRTCVKKPRAGSRKPRG